MQIVEVPDSEMSRREGQANRITAHREQHPGEDHDALPPATGTPPRHNPARHRRFPANNPPHGKFIILRLYR